MTPLLTIRRLSGSSILSTNNSPNNIDTYKDFFLLTFQSIKLNAKNLEIFNLLNSEDIYDKIKLHNIPFHKVNNYYIYY
jgi:hypothetical protein